VAHELAHIKRCDYLTNLWQRLIQAFFFFHPAVWFIGKQLAVERELACDDWAVKLTGEPRRYANCLTRLTELLRERKPLALAAGIIFGKHVVSRRIEMILNTNRNASTFVSKPALLYALGLATLFVSTYSFFSPVLAVPLAQTPAIAAQRQEVKAPVPATIETPQVVIVNGRKAVVAPRITPKVVEISQEEVPVIILPFDEITPVAMPVVATTLEPHIEEEDATPRPMPLVYQTQPAVFAPALYQQPAPPVQGQGFGSGSGSGQGFGVPGVSGTRSDTPTIPEAELIAVLTDIARRDTDPSVRNEALQGLYRLRTDNSINSLIQLYDTMTDVKVKGEILGNLMRRNKDNTKAIAKLVTIAKTEKDDTLRGRALSSLLYIKGDEGATHLIGIYDTLQDAKMKASVIRALAMNKSKKAIDKLIQIAKTDTDPIMRQNAVRSLYSIDEGIYLQLLDKARTGISSLDEPHLFRNADEAYRLLAPPAAATTPKPRNSISTPPPAAATVPTTPAPKRR
jgi:hypothetical protein